MENTDFFSKSQTLAALAAHAAGSRLDLRFGLGATALETLFKWDAVDVLTNVASQIRQRPLWYLIEEGEREDGGSRVKEGESVTGTLTHWVQTNSESCCHTSVSCESVVFYRMGLSTFVLQLGFPGERLIRGREQRLSLRYDRESVYRAYVALMRLRVIYWNAGGISGKTQDLRTLVQSQDIHVVLLGDTKLRPRQELRLPNFFVYRRDEVSPRGIAFRGTAVLLRRDIVHGGLEQPDFTNTRSIGVRVGAAGADLRLFAAYRPRLPFLFLRRPRSSMTAPRLSWRVTSTPTLPGARESSRRPVDDCCSILSSMGMSS
ncbi:RNA-directed DNA polymerase from mobile element jockey [Eumeta japonica]|uniref:RNA-directed DNA polymerase from mobile element jockey n=1 Tax=Eumeta variegata TaxID=151549 RepID=A0A4C1UC72_EUMVA|nr:RNA-directed DNA polymerase from mobile element jockey [Eumeta japonica]